MTQAYRPGSVSNSASSIATLAAADKRRHVFSVAQPIFPWGMSGLDGYSAVRVMHPSL